MQADSTSRLVLKSLKSGAIAAMLATTATAGIAAVASVSITSVSASAEPFSGNYVFAVDPYQTYTLSALEGGGAFGGSADGHTADDWTQGSNLLAQTASARATANTVVFTDPSTQLATAGFNLDAAASASPAGTATPNQAISNGLLAGTFMLIDGNGDPIAGMLTFDVYYDISVTRLAGEPAPDYGQALVSVLSSTDGGGNASFDDALHSATAPGNTGTTSSHFTWTFNLAQGEAAYFTLSGNAIAAAVPEPGSVAMFGVGMLALLPLVRRRLADANRG